MALLVDEKTGCVELSKLWSPEFELQTLKRATMMKLAKLSLHPESLLESRSSKCSSVKQTVPSENLLLESSRVLE